MKSKNQQQEEQKQELKLDSFELQKVRAGRGGVVFFDATINGISVHGMKVIPFSDGSGDFIAWPAQKGADGRYYNVCYARFSPDTEKSLLEKIQEALDASYNN